jgi:hypothetical protein
MRRGPRRYNSRVESERRGDGAFLTERPISICGPLAYVWGYFGFTFSKIAWGAAYTLCNSERVSTSPPT